MTAPTPRRTLRLHPKDSVALCLEAAAPGERVEAGVTALEAIPAGHKIALRAHAPGEVVLKYGQAIGAASQAIQPGQHVHEHNLSPEGGAGGAPAAPASQLSPREAWFEGYPRADGRFGTRNYIGVISSVNCSGLVARQIAAQFAGRARAPIDGVAAFTHDSGCGMAASGEAYEVLARTIAGYARHPNFGGVLLVGLGCEAMQTQRLLADAGLAEGPRLRRLVIQEAGGTRRAIEAGCAIVEELLAEAHGDRRQPASAAHLTLGLQCGGSDGWSGVTANPALGRAADLLAAAGGTAILSETPEIYGAEQLLYARAASPAVREALAARLAWWQAYAERHQEALNNNPSPGNRKGGLTTILEKSLGAVAKSGASPLMGVYGYAEPIAARGLVFMDSPGYDPCSATGQMAAGANLLAFTTGRGAVFGAKPAPCLKLASNRELATRMDEDIDIDCSPVLEGESLEALGEAIFARLLRLASGEPSKSEALGFGEHEFVPWRLGAVL